MTCFKTKQEIKDLKTSIEMEGEKLKLVIAMEEFAELQKTVSKIYREGINFHYAQLVDDIADALICIENLKIMYDVPDRNIDLQTKYKIAREKQKYE